MIGLPIFERELERAQRRRRTHWLRLAAAVAAVLVCWTRLDLLGALGTAGGAGRSMFFLLGGAMFGLALASGLFLTAPCLREEKETRMIELLLLTPLRPHQLLFGKLGARALQALQMVFAALPVLAVPVVVGGVSFAEFQRMAALLVITMLLSLAIGMWSAVRWQYARSAMFSALLGICGVTVVWGMIDDWIVTGAGWWGVDRFLLPGPLQAFYLVSDLNAAPAANTFGASLGFAAVMAVGVMWAACLGLRRVGVDTVWEGKRRSRWGKAVVPAGAVHEGWAVRRRVLRHNPAEWLARRRIGPGWHSAGMVLVLAGVWLGAWAHFGWSSEGTRFCALAGLAMLVHAVLKAVVAARAAGSFAFLRSSGELELLLATGLSTRRLERGFRRTRWRELLAPAVWVGLVDAAVLGLGLVVLGPERQFELWMLVWLMVVMAVVDVQVLNQVGMWQGLARSNVLQAVGAAALMVLVWPWFVFAATIGFAPTLYLYGLVMEEPMGWFLGAALWWWVVGFGCNAVFYFRARHQLREHFRELAVRTPRPVWSRLSAWRSGGSHPHRSRCRRAHRRPREVRLA